LWGDVRCIWQARAREGGPKKGQTYGRHIETAIMKEQSGAGAQRKVINKTRFERAAKARSQFKANEISMRANMSIKQIARLGQRTGELRHFVVELVLQL
jgi:hypothetical protein